MPSISGYLKPLKDYFRKIIPALRVGAFFLAVTFKSLSWAESVTPKNVEQVASSIQSSILKVWAEFVARIPYLIAGLFVLFLAWVTAAILSRAVSRVLR